MIGSRPLRFLVVLLFGWIMGRGMAIYETANVIVDQWVPQAQHRTAAMLPANSAPPAAAPGPPSPSRRPPTAVRSSTSIRPWTAMPTSVALLVPPPPGSIPQARQDAWIPPADRLLPIESSGSRWAASGWVIARGGMASSVSTAQLGASQAGLRLTYAVGQSRRVALAARVSTPLAGRGREAAVGLDWRPTAAPIHLLAEQRLSLDGGEGGPTLGLIGGFGPSQVGPGVLVEAYGQAGIIARGGGEAFADGAVRATHPLTLGGLRFDIGAGAWGGAQRGAARLDVGPTLGLVATVGGRAIRLSADWRQRIAGGARPGSGPALSVGTNF